MDRLLETVDQQTSSTVVAATEEPSDEEIFQQLMKKNPIWDFHSLTREQQLSKTKDQKINLMNSYDCSMKNGEIHLYFFLFDSLKSM